MMPLWSSARASGGHMPDRIMAVGARADVASGILGLAAHRADWPAGFHQGLRPLDESRGLGARDPDPCRRRLDLELGYLSLGYLLLLLGFFFLFEQLLHLHHEAVALLVPARADGRHDPRRLGEIDQVSLLLSLPPLGSGLLFSLSPLGSRRLFSLSPPGRGRGEGQLAQSRPEVAPKGADMLLLTLERDQRARLPRLEIEHALPRRAAGPGGEVIGRVQLEGFAHRPTMAPRLPSVELTVRSMGPP